MYYGYEMFYSYDSYFIPRNVSKSLAILTWVVGLGMSVS